MPLPKETACTAQDYWNLPEGHRAELIDGELYDMAPPGFIHQKLVSGLVRQIGNYIKERGGSCEVIPAPFTVNLNADDSAYVEPDLSVICDKNKLTDRGCEGAPDFIIEIVSPGSRKRDYFQKNALYSEAEVREYWIVDPERARTTVYRYEEDDIPAIIPFDRPVAAGIFPDLSLIMEELL